MATHRTRLAGISRWSVLLALANLLAACGGGSGPSDFGPPPPSGPPPASVTITGKITFDRIPFAATPGAGLEPSAPVQSPARGIVVEAINGSTVVASTTTNATGDYTLAVPSNTQIFIRAKAQMLKAGAPPTWDFRVRDNTNAGALYVLDGAVFGSGTADLTRNLRASSGWNGTRYGETRAAAPFAVLDTVYQATSLILSAAPTAVFAPLNLYWSTANRANTVAGNGMPIFCIDEGDIQTTMYASGEREDDCGGLILPGIYVLGSVEGGDTDEFDQHVIAHEFGHYFEDLFARSDSIGGAHENGNRLDFRVAFGEGWGNAFSGMVLNDPRYRDSYDLDARDFGFDMEADDPSFGDGGWFSETSVAEIIWDAFDATNESGDTVELGFRPIFAAMTNGQRTTPALTSIFSFLEALRVAAPTQAAGINQLRTGENIFGTDAFGAGETNAGGNSGHLPVYRPIALNGGLTPVCVSAANGVEKLGFSKFFRLDLASPSLVTINVAPSVDPAVPSGVPALDADVYLYLAGAVIGAGESDGPSETISQVELAAGTYVIEVLDFAATGNTPRCMSVSVTGT